jgi:hypothetical protein
MPIENIKNTNPTWESVSMRLMSDTSENGGVYGHQHAGRQVSHHDRQMQPLANPAHHTRHHDDNRQILDEIDTPHGPVCARALLPRQRSETLRGQAHPRPVGLVLPQRLCLPRPAKALGRKCL